MATSIIEHFSVLEDPRLDRNKKHEMIDVIVLCVCAMVSGANGWKDIEEFGINKLDWLRQFVPFENGIPVDDTIARIISALSVKGFQDCFSSWVDSVATRSDGDIIAIDGKTQRRSYDKKGQVKALHMVSAWACQNGVVMGQVKTDEKSNEITAIPELLSKLELSGCIVTIDAMGCQTKIAKQIIDAEGNYVLSLKGNQGLLSEAVRHYFEMARKKDFKGIEFQYDESIDKGHGRVEERRYWLVTDLDTLPKPERWAGLASIGMVESTRHCGDSISTEQRYFINSIDTVKEFKHAVRGHWGIENSLHWRLDVTFREDDSRIRRGNAPHNVGVIRHMAINLLKSEKSKRSVAGKRLRAAYNDAYRVKVLLQN